MLIDDIVIKVHAGNGGRGAVAFTKNLMSLGPAGGSGGNGGSVYFEGVSDLSALGQFRFKKVLRAKDGENGKSQFNDGTTGEDAIFKVPVGTIFKKVGERGTYEILKIGEKILVARGGHGGKGNYLFRSSRNTTPRGFQEGLPGEECTVHIELRLIADIGLIGLPNAGKSSLLNELTDAKSKVANYAFTTLEPNLGVYYNLILADIPGLIEGASTGRGLGDKFLRHVERTKILFHLISSESDDPARDYKIIREELGAYNKEMLKKEEYLFFSKSDMLSAKDLKTKLASLKKLNKSAIAISIHDWDSMEKVKKILNKINDKK